MIYCAFSFISNKKCTFENKSRSFFGEANWFWKKYFLVLIIFTFGSKIKYIITKLLLYLIY